MEFLFGVLCAEAPPVLPPTSTKVRSPDRWVLQVERRGHTVAGSRKVEVVDTTRPRRQRYRWDVDGGRDLGRDPYLNW